MGTKERGDYMAYGWGINEPAIKPLEEGGDNINQYALKIKDALDALYIELRQDIVRATLAESIAATDIKKIITPSTAFRTYYGTGEPSDLQGKNSDMYIRYGGVKDTYIKVSGAWQKIDAVPQPATLAEVNAGLLTTKYVTPQTLKIGQPGGCPRLDGSGLLPSEYARVGIEKWTAPGTYKWTCPAHVKFVLITGCGGGGGGGADSRWAIGNGSKGDVTSFDSLVSITGGGGGTRAASSSYNGSVGIDGGPISAAVISDKYGVGGAPGSSGAGRGGKGGRGGAVVNYCVDVVGGQTYTITIGQGGAGGLSDWVGGGRGSGGLLMLQLVK